MSEQAKAGPALVRTGHDEPADRQAASSLVIVGGTADIANDVTAPYSHAAWVYLRNGWSPFPLPAGQKHPPPKGRTGYGAPHASGPDVQAWIEDGHATGNVGLRLPDTVLGLDVDAYGNKPGEQTMRDAIARLGPLPRAPRSTSRGPGDVSGIRFYRVPPGRRWADVLGPGVEVIHHGHRYAVVWPSRHPEGGTYRWYDAAGRELSDPPGVDELPELPAHWVRDLDRGDVADRAEKADLAPAEVAALLAEMPDGEPCRYITRLIHEARDAFSTVASRHDTGRDTIAKIVRAGEQGHTGAREALEAIEQAWRAALAQGDARDPDPGEWARMVNGAVAIVTNDPTHPLDKGCCGPDPAPDQYDDPTLAAMDRQAAFARDVDTQLYKLQVTEAAREKLAATKAAALIPPPFDADLLADVLTRPADPPHRVTGLIPTEAGTLVVAQRKTGKTTLLLNLARSLITGEPFLNRFAVRAITGRVAFLNFEVSAAQLARWADEAAVPRDRLYLVNLRERRNPLGHPEDRAELAGLLREQGIETLMVDPFGRAYTGQSQNDPGEVGAWLADLDRFARGDCGAVDLILATHAGWNGERTRGASALEDWADSITTLTRDPDDESCRYLRATGRDVEVDEDRLYFDPATRLLSLTGQGSRKQAKTDRHVNDLMAALVQVVNAQPGLGIAEITGHLRGQPDPLSFRDRDVSKASLRAEQQGLIRRVSHGSGKRTEHHPVQPRPNPVQGRTPHTPSTPSIGDGVGVRGVAPDPEPVDGDGVPTENSTPTSLCAVCHQPYDNPNALYCDTCMARARDAVPEPATENNQHQETP